MKDEYTATEIAEVLCKSQDLELNDQSQLFFRVKYMAKRGLLSSHRTLDLRGTLAFRPLEVYRAAMLNELMGLAIDVRVLTKVLEAASKSFYMPLLPVPPSMKVDGAVVSRGGLRDAIRGAAQDEGWYLNIWRVNPSYMEGEGIRAEILMGDYPIAALEAFDEDDEMAGRKPSRAHVSVDLTAVFKPIVHLIGDPK